MTLREYIDENGYRKSAIAKRIGVTSRTILNYQGDPDKIPLGKSFKLCEMLSLDFVAFAQGKIKPLKYQITNH